MGFRKFEKKQERLSPSAGNSRLTWFLSRSLRCILKNHSFRRRGTPESRTNAQRKWVKSGARRRLSHWYTDWIGAYTRGRTSDTAGRKRAAPPGTKPSAGFPQ